MIYKHLLEIADNFDAFVFDAYGVFNFGKDFSQSAIKVMKDLKSQFNKVSILSNASQVSSDAMKKYDEKGLNQGEHYVELLTSGQYAYEDIQAGNLPIEGKKVYVAWTANFKKPDDIVPGLFKNSSYEIVTDINYADFAYVGVPQINYEDRLEIDDFIPELKKLKEHNLTLVCANPDLRALEALGYVVRQGMVSAEYEYMGGKVVYYGKPDARVYDRALETLGNPDRSRVLMVGDTLRTDILGANRAGIKSCLVLENGVTANEMKDKSIALTEKNVHAYAAKQNTKVDYIVQKLPKTALF